VTAALYSCAPRRRFGDIPKSQWDAQHFADAIADAEKMHRLALQHPTLMDVNGWRERADDLKRERDQRVEAGAA
jgi:hypothetical protein